MGARSGSSPSLCPPRVRGRAPGACGGLSGSGDRKAPRLLERGSVSTSPAEAASSRSRRCLRSPGASPRVWTPAADGRSLRAELSRAPLFVSAGGKADDH